MLQSDAILLPPPASASDGPAVILPPKTGQLVIRTQESIAQLGVAAGDRVVLALPNCIEFIILFLALIRQRAVVAPLNPEAKLNEQTQMLERIRPVLVLLQEPLTRQQRQQQMPTMQAAQAQKTALASCSWAVNLVALEAMVEEDGTGAAAARPPAPTTAPDAVNPSDVVLLHYTSGTTGQPKAVGLSHATILASVRILVAAHGLTPTDRTIIVAPFFHVGGTCSSLLCSLASGGCSVLPRALAGDFWLQVATHGISWYHAVPTLHRLLLSFPRAAPPRLRFIRSGGSSISGELIAQLERELGCPVLEGYGMTETVQAVVCNRVADAGGRQRAYYPVPQELDIQIRVSEAAAASSKNADADADGPVPFCLTSQPGQVGEICLRGACVIPGYLDNPVANAAAFQDGFFRTGDLGMLHDRAGRMWLQVTGRIKEMINKGGEKISPMDIEEILLAHEAVGQVACFRVPDETYGEDIGVAVIVKPGFELKPLDVKRFVRQQSVHFKVPKMVTFVDAIPTNRAGKYVRAALADQFATVAV